ncbi:TPA: hypothetical protein PBP10_005004 [Escherichia coli]|nr:hypothetical protein [Escherichia coli]
MREVTPLAAAPATERSERVGEEAEENRNHIEHVRTDAGCRGEALTRRQTEYRRG